MADNKSTTDHVERLARARKEKLDMQDRLKVSGYVKQQTQLIAETAATATPVHALPVVELLEKERREWQAERLKLVHCIHLQQLELSQRASAAHDRATDIAKDFARVIECFEERLVAVENNVQTELLALKKIAEQIRAAVAPSGQQQGSGASGR